MHGQVNSGSKTAGFRSSEATGLQSHLSITNEGPDADRPQSLRFCKTRLPIE